MRVVSLLMLLKQFRIQRSCKKTIYLQLRNLLWMPFQIPSQRRRQRTFQQYFLLLNNPEKANFVIFLHQATFPKRPFNLRLFRLSFTYSKKVSFFVISSWEACFQSWLLLISSSFNCFIMLFKAVIIAISSKQIGPPRNKSSRMQIKNAKEVICFTVSTLF